MGLIMMKSFSIIILNNYDIHVTQVAIAHRITAVIVSKIPFKQWLETPDLKSECKCVCV